MKQPVQIDNVFAKQLHHKLYDEINKTGWFLHNESTPNSRKFWKQYQEENPIFQDAGQFISNKAEQFIGKNKLIRINVNGQTLNQQGSAHIDYPHRDHYTFVYFSNTKWDKRWDGAFRVFTDSASYSYDYQSNSGVLVHADWPHYGQAPNINTDSLRTTIAWSYCEIH